jgi:hypothetical protein
MLPMVTLRLRLGVLLAADATTLAEATLANKIALIGAPFALNENLRPSDLTLLIGNGLDPILCAVGPQETAIETITDEQVITLVPGAGSGFRWVTSGTFAAPVTVYGAALLSNDESTVLAAMSMPSPIALQSAGYQIDIDPQTIHFVTSPMY